MERAEPGRLGRDDPLDVIDGDRLDVGIRRQGFLGSRGTRHDERVRRGKLVDDRCAGGECRTAHRCDVGVTAGHNHVAVVTAGRLPRPGGRGRCCGDQAPKEH